MYLKNYFVLCCTLAVFYLGSNEFANAAKRGNGVNQQQSGNVINGPNSKESVNVGPNPNRPTGVPENGKIVLSDEDKGRIRTMHSAQSKINKSVWPHILGYTDEETVKNLGIANTSNRKGKPKITFYSNNISLEPIVNRLSKYAKLNPNDGECTDILGAINGIKSTLGVFMATPENKDKLLRPPNEPSSSGNEIPPLSTSSGTSSSVKESSDQKPVENITPLREIVLSDKLESPEYTGLKRLIQCASLSEDNNVRTGWVDIAKQLRLHANLVDGFWNMCFPTPITEIRDEVPLKTAKDYAWFVSMILGPSTGKYPFPSTETSTGTNQPTGTNPFTSDTGMSPQMFYSIKLGLVKPPNTSNQSTQSNQNNQN